MLFEAPIVQILEAEGSVCLFSEHRLSIILCRCFLCFIAVAKNLHNILMLKHLEVMKLVCELLIIKL